MGAAQGKALDVVVRRDVRETETLVISFDYESTKAVEAVFRTHNLAVKETNFDAKVSMELEVPIEEMEQVRDALIQRTAGKVVFSSDEPLNDPFLSLNDRQCDVYCRMNR